MFLVWNEQTKLTAVWLNTLATAMVAAGTFAPLTAVLYGFSTADRSSLAIVGGVCLAGGTVLHLGGRLLLRRLRE